MTNLLKVNSGTAPLVGTLDVFWNLSTVDTDGGLVVESLAFVTITALSAFVSHDVTAAANVLCFLIGEFIPAHSLVILCEVL